MMFLKLYSNQIIVNSSYIKSIYITQLSLEEYKFAVCVETDCKIDNHELGYFYDLKSAEKYIDDIWHEIKCRMKQKTDWTQIPDWANYTATDEDGTVRWFECEPYLGIRDGKKRWCGAGGKTITQNEYLKSAYIYETLEKRP